MSAGKKHVIEELRKILYQVCCGEMGKKRGFLDDP